MKQLSWSGKNIVNVIGWLAQTKTKGLESQCELNVNSVVLRL